MLSAKHIRHYLIIQTLLMLQWTGYACADNNEEISADALLQKITSGESPVILDTRSGFEYNRSHVPGAKHFPFWLSYMRADDLDLPGDQPIVVYCAHGPRAVVAKHALEKNGFTDVKLLSGHMTGWKKAGLPVERPAGK